MYQFGICGMGHNGFMNQIMTSQEAADNVIKELKKEIDCQRDPNLLLATMNLNGITELDKQRIKKEVERYASYGY